MRNYRGRAGALAAAAVLILALAAAGQAAPQNFQDPVHPSGFNLSGTTTSDATDTIATYLGGNSFALVTDVDIAALGRMVSEEIAPQELTVVAYDAPADAAAAPESRHAPEPPARLASFAYPDAGALAMPGADGRAVPLADARNLAMGPTGYGGVMTGRPTAGMPNWTHANQTAISYVRPHVNVQMMFALELPGATQAGAFEGPGMEPHAYLAVDHQTKVDSADLGAYTEQFGGRPPTRSVDEPQTAVAAGLDLGLLPTYLSQMGMSISVVASRGEETGNLRIALVGTTELPVDWAPRERPYQHPVGLAVDPLWAASGLEPQYQTGGVSGHPPGGGGGGGTGWTPITPVVPEPATLAMLATAAVMAVARLRRRRR
jgi:hypothetical protein